MLDAECLGSQSLRDDRRVVLKLLGPEWIVIHDNNLFFFDSAN